MFYGDTMKRLFYLLVFPLVLNVSLAQDNPWQKSLNLEAQGDYVGALAAIEPIVDSNKNHEYALLRYAWLSYLQGKHSVAIDYYSKAIKLNSESLDAKLGIMLPLMAQTRWREAMQFGSDVIKKAPYQYYAHVRLMACEEALLQWNALTERAEKISKVYPLDSTILVYLGRGASVSGKTAIAIKAYQGVVERVPGHLEAIRYLTSQGVKI